MNSERLAPVRPERADPAARGAGIRIV